MPLKKQFDKLVIASQNKGKIAEFERMLLPAGCQVLSLYDYTNLPEIVESGSTFYENALIKAQIIAEHLKVPVLADDSGLCVDALNGAPGVYSARYAGENASDQENNRKLLAELIKISKGRSVQCGDELCLSTARFVCALVIYDPVSGQIVHAEGSREGCILPQPRGENGFGYDPLFYLPEFGKTMAELSAEEKNKISHRGEALRKLVSALAN
jgi:XTP/dITP diphosphohydrolase